MQSTLYDLAYDFTQQNGHFLVFTGTSKKPLRPEDVVELQKKMIQSNDIPRMLPVQIEEINGQIRLRYEMTSTTMFRPFIRGKKLSMEDYYEVFLGIVSALEESRVYMLNSENHLLQEDFIFIGRDIYDVQLVYLPLVTIPGKKPVTEDLKSLLVNTAGEVEGLNGEAFKDILNYTKDAGFRLSGLKELLLKRRRDHSPRAHTNRPNVAEPEPISPPVLNEPPEFASEPIEKSEQALIKDFENPPQIDYSERSNRKIERPAFRSREKIYLFAFVLIGLAIIWKVNEMYSNPYMIYACGGMSALIVGVAVVYWKMGRSGAERVPSPGPEKEVAIQSNAPVGFKEIPDVPEPLQGTAVQQQGPFYRKESVASSTLSNQNDDYYNHLQQNTTLLSASDETVMLNHGSDAVESENTNPYFVVARSGSEEKIEIHSDAFVIGRSVDNTQYVEDSAGVSRLHLEVVKSDEGCVVKDLGSRNGSRLNGQSLVPYKLYELNEGDELELGQVTYLFRAAKGL
ncbi:MAG TPA: DUF6382 domain-containing protein [Bacillales bacterium]|nr:DUF6382 domain-containing protein [Bacillales bacterium]